MTPLQRVEDLADDVDSLLIEVLTAIEGEQLPADQLQALALDLAKTRDVLERWTERLAGGNTGFNRGRVPRPRNI